MVSGGVAPRILNLGTKVQPHTPAALTRHRLQRRLDGPQKGLDDLEKRKTLSPSWNLAPIFQSSSPHRRLYGDCAVSALWRLRCKCFTETAL
jgi:hypothetical protein